MKLTQQQIDELRAWQHEKAPGGELVIRFHSWEAKIVAVASGRDGTYFKDFPCD